MEKEKPSLTVHGQEPDMGKHCANSKCFESSESFAMTAIIENIADAVE